MKTNTTYPTKHPHWIDEPEYLDAIKKRKRVGISFATAFVLVLAIHLAGVGGIFAFSNLKSDKKPPAVAEAPVEKHPGPKSDSLARNEWPQPEAQPKAVATPPPVKKQVVATQVAPKAAPVVAAKPKEKAVQPAIAKATPKPAPSKVDDAAAKKAFLATRSNSQPPSETQQTIPAVAQVQPVVSSNAEVKTESVATQAPATTAPTKTLEPAVTSAPASRPSEYTLAPGDNLYMVSRRLQVSYNDLMQANGLSDPCQLRVGQKLKVPAEQIASL